MVVIGCVLFPHTGAAFILKPERVTTLPFARHSQPASEKAERSAARGRGGQVVLQAFVFLWERHVLLLCTVADRPWPGPW